MPESVWTPVPDLVNATRPDALPIDPLKAPFWLL